MGIRLIAEVLDGAPETLTWRELYVLVVLAENARDGTRQCWPGVEDNPDVIRRLRLSRTQRYKVIGSLIDKGALVRVKRGQKGVRAVYAIPPLAAQRPENRDPDETLSVPETGTLNESQRPGSVHSGSRFGTFSVPETGTPSPHTPQTTHPRARARETSRTGDAGDGGGQGQAIRLVVRLLEELGGSRVSDAYAAQVVRSIGPGKRDTLAYIEKCIRNDPARFMPTPQPPRFTAANGFEP